MAATMAEIRRQLQEPSYLRQRLPMARPLAGSPAPSIALSKDLARIDAEEMLATGQNIAVVKGELAKAPKLGASRMQDLTHAFSRDLIRHKLIKPSHPARLQSPEQSSLQSSLSLAHSFSSHNVQSLSSVRTLPNPSCQSLGTNSNHKAISDRVADCPERSTPLKRQKSSHSSVSSSQTSQTSAQNRRASQQTRQASAPPATVCTSDSDESEQSLAGRSTTVFASESEDSDYLDEMSTPHPAPQPATGGAKRAFSRRTRTGCKTCRRRHLKCDEGTPVCQNCLKLGLVCDYNVYLKYTKPKVQPITVLPKPDGWHVQFIDESREINSEYPESGVTYPRMPRQAESLPNPALRPPQSTYYANAGIQVYDFAPIMPRAPNAGQPLVPQPLPSIQGMFPEVDPTLFQQPQSLLQPPAPVWSPPGFYEPSIQPENIMQLYQTPAATLHTHDPPGSSHQSSNPNFSSSSYSHIMQDVQFEQEEAKDIMTSREETLYMQVFVEEVAIWMDSMDPNKHFSRMIPFHALEQPMLLNAILACGLRHLTLMEPASYDEEKAVNYYDKATQYLLRELQNPHRDGTLCATSAVILNVYEIMTEKATARMSHIAGARALIRECGWDARATGIGGACFWLNVGMELLSNLHFNWHSAWHPDAWGLDLDFTPESAAGREELWTHRIVYITAKVCILRASTPKQGEQPTAAHAKPEWRTVEWGHLKGMLDRWNASIPRTMQPLSHLFPYQSAVPSAFPELWILKRTTIVARLFYHTAMVLLARINPLQPVEKSTEMNELQQQHARQICSIVAHNKDRGVASVSIRSLAIAAESLTNQREQAETLMIFRNIHRETGWRIGSLPKELTEKWGWSYNPAKLPTHDNPMPYMSPTIRDSRVSFGRRTTRWDRGFQSELHGERQALMGQSQGSQHQRSSVDPQSHRDDSAALPSTTSPHQQQPQAQQASSSTPPRPKFPQGIINPLLANSDFAKEQHPYQGSYVAPAFVPREHASQHHSHLNSNPHLTRAFNVMSLSNFGPGTGSGSRSQFMSSAAGSNYGTDNSRLAGPEPSHASYLGNAPSMLPAGQYSQFYQLSQGQFQPGQPGQPGQGQSGASASGGSGRYEYGGGRGFSYDNSSSGHNW